MAFTTHDRHPFLPGFPSAPPPTPSNNPRPPPSSTSSFSSLDPFSSFLQLSSTLPLSLSLNNDCNPSPSPLPTVSLLEKNSSIAQDVAVAAKEYGFFQLIDHGVSSETARQTHLHYSSALLQEQCHAVSDSEEWPLGLEEEEEEEETEGGRKRSLCFDGSSSVADGFRGEFLAKLGSIGCRVMEALGFEECAGVCVDCPSRLVWISTETVSAKPTSARSYPYVVGLQYQSDGQDCFLRSSSGWVSVSPQKDSILVTIGDIAKVWSNGRFSHIIGRPVLKSSITETHRCYPLTMLMTFLPFVDRTILPQPDFYAKDGDEENHKGRKFVSFSFQEHAYRIYNQRFFLKDPLTRYAVKNLK